MAMEFRFDASQDYQLKAIAAVTGLFDGQPYIRNELVNRRADLSPSSPIGSIFPTRICSAISTRCK